MTVAPTRSGARSAGPLHQLLNQVRLRGEFYGEADLTAPWNLEMPAYAGAISFHVVTQGHCVLVTADDERLLEAGDLALVPHGAGHQLLSGEVDIASEPVEMVPQIAVGPRHSRMTHGGGGEPARLICGVVSFDAPAAKELARRLPSIIHLQRRTLPAHARVLESVRMMGEELAEAAVGGDVLASRLADIIVVQAIRTWLSEDPAAHQGWFVAVNDPDIGPALVALHRDPGAAWTLSAMARQAAMSRSAFSERFRQLMDETPMSYLTRWRMDVAATMLRDPSTATWQVAHAVGYESEVSFARAFHRVVGLTPAAWRRTLEDEARRSVMALT